jgi:hypothetical protein
MPPDIRVALEELPRGERSRFVVRAVRKYISGFAEKGIWNPFGETFPKRTGPDPYRKEEKSEVTRCHK